MALGQTVWEEIDFEIVDGRTDGRTDGRPDAQETGFTSHLGRDD